MAHVHASGPRKTASSISGRLPVALSAAWERFWIWKAARATVYILHSLDDRTLKDLGMDRTEIESVVYGQPCGGSAASGRRIAMCAKMSGP